MFEICIKFEKCKIKPFSFWAHYMSLEQPTHQDTSLTFWFQMNVVVRAHLCAVHQLSHYYRKAIDVSSLRAIERIIDFSQKLWRSPVHLFIFWILERDQSVFGSVFEFPQTKAGQLDLHPAVHQTRAGP